MEVDAHANYHGTDPCYGAGRCYGRIPSGGEWGEAHIPGTGRSANPSSVPALCSPGQACDDGNVCTAGDACSPACACAPGAALVCDDQNPCTTDACYPATGCVNPPLPDGTACPGGQTCQGGECGGSDATPCVATGGTYKTVSFTRDEGCRAVAFLNKARYSRMSPITTTARDIAYDCTPEDTCGRRASAWNTVAEYAAANGSTTTMTVGATSLKALKAASATWVDDGLWYDTVARTMADAASLNNVWVHLEGVLAGSRSGFCLYLYDTPADPVSAYACIDPWYCGPDGCPADHLQPCVGRWLSARGRLTNETGSWRIVIKTIGNTNPAVVQAVNVFDVNTATASDLKT
ncbi:MAG: hypothetical protein FJ087_23165 [Deltaproteobacteria bacterium]|nr:hypothetical protein [Deltaproteobacteria bacterium]